MRWQPDSPGKLEIAALDMFEERGFENVTVAEIAQRAGLTERTFFRHYRDKREVLFGGGPGLEALMVEAAAAAPAGAAPIEAVAAAVAAAGELLEGRRDYAVRRAAIINASPELMERELIKLASLSAAVAATLRERGVAEPDASLAAETGVGLFHVTFRRWVGEPGSAPFPQLIQQSLSRLRALTAKT